ncbi:MAG TPA: DUF1501 domain-containing protein [Frankiaceae bacterium]|jgi:uncharacterized protein (DUF1501 family)|nr:DUF1501 domain-containing protein [Frankiaceae bacterium]
MSPVIPEPRRASDLETDCCAPRRGVTRRSVLAAMGVTAGAAAVSPLASRIAFAADASYSGDVLVVLSMHGGWDTLSIVPPIGDPSYSKLRPNLAIPSGLALPAGGIFGLHPALAPLKPYYDSGQFGVVHAAGQPNGVRSHFQDEAELERAAPGTSVRTGWIDRVLEQRVPGTAFQAVELGSSMLPNSLIGPAASLAMADIADFSLAIWSGYQPAFGAALASMHTGLAHPVAKQAGLTLDALGTTASMQSAGYTPSTGATYPTSDLGKALKDLAWMIKSNIGLQIACLDYGNWDMHADLGKPGDTSGWLHKQLADVAACLAAFASDLGPAFANVNIVTLSEFGRRAAENGSGGADHGLGQAVLALGGGINGGHVIGQWPTLAAGSLADGDLAVTTDYRSILTEVLTKRCGLTGAATLFPGFTPAAVGIAK